MNWLVLMRNVLEIDDFSIHDHRKECYIKLRLLGDYSDILFKK